MVHKNNFVAVLRVNNQILREDNDNEGNKIVTLPFSSEFDIMLKNLNSRRALVKISLDGQSVIDDLVVNANSESTIERFFEGSMSSGHKFKFIQKTKEIQEHRGDKIDDGLLRIEYRFEKEVQEVIKKIIHEEHHYDHYNHRGGYWCDCWSCRQRRWPWRPEPQITYSSNTTTYDSGYVNSANMAFGSRKSIKSSVPMADAQQAVNVSMNFVSAPQQEEGITVKGSQSQQTFTYASIGELEANSTVIIIKMRGTTSTQVEVKKAVTTKEKVRCEICGRFNKSVNQFCTNCGTNLR